MDKEEKQATEFYRIKRGTLARREETERRDSKDRPVRELVYYGNEPGQKSVVELTEDQAKAFGTDYLEQVSAEDAKRINGDPVVRSDPSKGPSEQGDGRQNDELTDEEKSALDDQRSKIEGQQKDAAKQAASTVKPENTTREEARPNFDELTASELREYAETHNIDLTGKSSKADVLAEVKKRSRR